VVAVYATRSGAALTGPAALTERGRLGQTSSAPATTLLVLDGIVATSGSTGDYTATSAAATSSVAQLVGWKPGT
jgi:hypothetical protein